MSKKKRIGKNGYTSQGSASQQHRCRSLTPIQRLRNQQEAWLKGKRVMLVIDAAGNKAEAQAVWGLPPMLRKKVTNA